MLTRHTGLQAITVLRSKYRTVTKDGRRHTLYAYAIDTNGGENTLLSAPTEFRIAPAHLKYLGYYGNAVQGIGDRNYTADISDHANVSWTGYRGPVSEGWEDELEKIRVAGVNYNMKSVLDLRWLFFDGNTRLMPGYETRWREKAAEIKRRNLTQYILAFYPLDEPYWSGCKDVANPVSSSETKQQLEIVNALIKAEFPDKPIAVIFAAPDVTRELQIPEGYDWIGFDRYDCFENCPVTPVADEPCSTEPFPTNRSIPEYLNILKSKLTGNQKLILVPDGNVVVVPANTPVTLQRQTVLAETAEKYFDLAANESKVVGMFTFIYPSFLNDPNDVRKGRTIGVIDMPIVRNKYYKYGRTILAK